MDGIFTIPDLARELGYSEGYFRKIFKERVKVEPFIKQSKNGKIFRYWNREQLEQIKKEVKKK